MEDFWVIGIIVFSCFLLYKIYKYKEKYSKLQNDYQQTKKLYESLQKEFSKLKSDMEKNERDLGTAKEQLERLEEYKIALILNYFLVQIGP